MRQAHRAIELFLSLGLAVAAASAPLVLASLGQEQMAGRLAGVDVAVLLPELDPAGARLWLAALQGRLDSSEPLRAAGLSVGHGLAECLADDTADQQLLRADAALRGFA